MPRRYASNGAWPADNTAAGLGRRDGHPGQVCLRSGHVTDGQITITYGNQANAANLVGKTLKITPGTSANGDVSWQCGSKDMSGTSGITVASGLSWSASTDFTVKQKYLPAECRG